MLHAGERDIQTLAITMTDHETTEVLTIGHSTRDYESFLSVLKDMRVSAIADVRSSPKSQQFPTLTARF